MYNEELTPWANRAALLEAWHGHLGAAADERVIDVKFKKDTLSVALRDGRTITVPLAWYPRLFNATAAQRKNWQVAGGGYGIHWPDVDEDLSTEGLLRPPALRRAADADNASGRTNGRQGIDGPSLALRCGLVARVCDTGVQ